MAKITNHVKKINRITTLVIRAIESCFEKPEIYEVKSGFDQSNFSIEVNAFIFSDKFIRISTNAQDVNVCLKSFIDKVLELINDIIDDLQKMEKEYTSSIERYGQALTESSAIQLSSSLMFKRIIESIKI